MKVTPIEFEQTRFRVSSESGEEDYLVDVEEYNFNGRCDCLGFRSHFLRRLESAQEYRTKVKTPLRCKHIRHALLEYLRLGGKIP